VVTTAARDQDDYEFESVYLKDIVPELKQMGEFCMIGKTVKI